jgi:hypothetical protein
MPDAGSTTINLPQDAAMPTISGTGDGGPSNSTLYDERIRLALVAAVFISFDGFLLLMAVGALKDLSDTLKGMALSAFILWVGSMVNFYWGSSSGSKAKDDRASIVSGSVISGR